MAQTVFILIDSSIPSVSLGILENGTTFTYSYAGTGEGIQFSPYTIELGAGGLMAFNAPNEGKSAVFGFDEIISFEINGADQLTGGSAAADLQDVIDRCLPFFVEAGQGGGSLSGVGLFYVSASAAGGGNGSLERPYQTITAANTAAAAFISGGGYIPTIIVIGGQYDEAIPALSAHLVFNGGANILYTDTSEAASIVIDGSIGDELTITGAYIQAQGTGVYALSAVGSCRFVGCRFSGADGGAILDASAAIFTNCRIASSSGIGVTYGPTALSTASFTGCSISSGAAAAIDVQAAGAKLYQCRLSSPTNSVTASAGAQTIETAGTVAKGAVGAGVTQVVGTITVNANVTVD